MPSPAVLSWPTAPGSVDVHCSAPLALGWLSMAIKDRTTEQDEWRRTDRAGHVCFTLVYKAERYVPGSDNWLFINAEAKISRVVEEETSMGRCD